MTEFTKISSKEAEAIIVRELSAIEDGKLHHLRGLIRIKRNKLITDLAILVARYRTEIIDLKNQLDCLTDKSDFFEIINDDQKKNLILFNDYYRDLFKIFKLIDSLHEVS
jgi:hypothetical protein